MDNINFCDQNHILVGLGGTGGKILRAFKMRMFEEFPTQEERKSYRFLCFILTLLMK